MKLKVYEYATIPIYLVLLIVGFALFGVGYSGIFNITTKEEAEKNDKMLLAGMILAGLGILMFLISTIAFVIVRKKTS